MTHLDQNQSKTEVEFTLNNMVTRSGRIICGGTHISIFLNFIIFIFFYKNKHRNALKLNQTF